jgi:hypothetical protein
MTAKSLVAPRFLFRFSVPCRYSGNLGGAQGSNLDERYRLASFAELDGKRAWADVRAAWSEEGLAFSIAVSGKKQPPWCRSNRPEESDGVQIWIDTRDVHNIHRATRFCHRFLFMPGGHGKQHSDPLAQWLPIHRARDQPRAIQSGDVKVRSQTQSGGYLLDAFLAAGALTGFEPQEHPSIGFNYAVVDRELGELTFSAGSPLPYREDPSLWATLELVK